MQEATILRNNYRLERLLGRGGMADVYLAFDLRRQAHVALKVLREDLAEDPEFVRRFAREADALARLEHPNVVRFYSFERKGATAFIVMDYVPGTTLQRRLAEAEGPLPLEEVTAMLRRVGAALQFAHGEGYVHRDVKPGNVMLREDGNALLSDFGIARAAESATLTTMAMGTPAYMSPEQILGRELDRRTDIYSLGVVLYELTTGRRPFTGDEYGLTSSGTTTRLREAHLKLPPPDPRTFNPALPAGVAQVIVRALAKEPADRWPDVLSLLQASEGALGKPAAAVASPAAGAATPTLLAGQMPGVSTPARPTPKPAGAKPLPTPAGEVLLPPERTPGRPAASPVSAPVRGGRSLLPWLIGATALALLIVIVGLWRLIATSTTTVSKVETPPIAAGDVEKTAQALAAVYAQATTNALATLSAPTMESARMTVQAAEKTITVVTVVAAKPQTTAGVGPTARPPATATPPPATSTPAPKTATPLPASPTPTATTGAYVTVKSGEVNLRGGPGTQYNVVGQAKTGTNYPIVSRTAAGDWLRLEGNEERWVAASLVTVSGDVPVAAKLPPTPIAAPVAETPILLLPVDGFTLWPYDAADFKWKWTGRPLGPNEGFELRIWKEGNPDHPGAAPPVAYVAGADHVYSIHIGSIRASPGVVDISTTDWINVYWTVAVVQLNPYRRTGPEAKPFWIHT